MPILALSQINASLDPLYGIIGALNNTARNMNDNLINPLNYMLIDILSFKILLFIVITYIAYRIILRFRRYELVFERIENASGVDELDKYLNGFKQIAREKLIEKMDFVQSKATARISESGLRSSFDYIRPPEDTPDPALNDLAASIQELIPSEKPKANIFQSFIKFFGPQKGLMVSCIFQRVGKETDRIGITIKISDINRKLEPKVHTIWEIEKPSLCTTPLCFEMKDKRCQLYNYIIKNTLRDDCREYQGSEDLTLVFNDLLSRIETSIQNLENSSIDNLKNRLEKALALLSMPLSPDSRNLAKKSWIKLAKKKNKDDEAFVYFSLARAYMLSGLLDESAELAKKSKEKGMPAAEKELERFKIEESETLIWSSDNLMKLYPVDAKGYVDLAVRIHQENPRAEASSEALKVDSVANTLNERYLALIEPSVLWLALEIYRMRMLDKIDSPFRSLMKFNNESIKSEIYNFIGFIHLYYGFCFDGGSRPESNEIYRIIDYYFNEAKKIRNNWYLPYENLGNSYSTRGRYNYRGRKYNLMQKAIVEYETALIKAKAELNINSIEFITASNRITISKALARLRIAEDRKEMILKALEEINSLYSSYSISDYLSHEESARSLYNLACWYSLAKNYYESPDDAIKWSSICLAYALARDRYSSIVRSDYGILWDHIDVDSDLDEIRHQDFSLESLKYVLSMKLIKTPDMILYPLQFKSTMQEVFLEAGWHFALQMTLPPKIVAAYSSFQIDKSG